MINTVGLGTGTAALEELPALAPLIVPDGTGEALLVDGIADGLDAGVTFGAVALGVTWGVAVA